MEKLVEATPEERQIFQERLTQILDELSLSLNVGITKQIINAKDLSGKDSLVFVDVPSLVVQRKEILSPIQNEDIEKTS